MDGQRAAGWWPTRILLAIAIGTTLLFALFPFVADDFHDEAVQVGPLLIWGRYLVAIVGLLMAMAGLIWMIRIVRGPRDEPPRWRYRDR